MSLLQAGSSFRKGREFSLFFYLRESPYQISSSAVTLRLRVLKVAEWFVSCTGRRKRVCPWSSSFPVLDSSKLLVVCGNRACSRVDGTAMFGCDNARALMT
jgi:hypothetical protein